MSHVAVYEADRAAAASAWGVSGREPRLPPTFARQLVAKWDGLALAYMRRNEQGRIGIQPVVLIPGVPTQAGSFGWLGNRYGDEQIPAARNRLLDLLERGGLAVGGDGLLSAPADFWALVFKLASSIDRVSEEPTRAATNLDILAGTAKDTAATIADGAQELAGAAGGALEKVALILAAAFGLYLVVKG